MNNTIAIDFGTMRTKLSYIDPRTRSPELMRLGQDERPFVPSVFFLGEDGRRMYGDLAIEYLKSEPLGFLPRPLKRDLQKTHVRAGNLVIATPTELLSLLIGDLRERTKELPAFRDCPPDGLVLTSPAQYGTAYRMILKTAAQAAGFSEDRIKFIDEPVAAAHAWLSEIGGMEEYIVVLDCGGGTLDWACLRRAGENIFEIVPELPPSGDTSVGGCDIDEELLALLDDHIKEAEDQAILRTTRCLVRDQIRILKEKYSRTGLGGHLDVGRVPVTFDPDVIKDTIQRRYISQTVLNLNGFLEKIQDHLKCQMPTVLLVGGSAMLRGLREAIGEQRRCKVEWWERSEYATVLGALLPTNTVKTSSRTPLPIVGQHVAPNLEAARVVYEATGTTVIRSDAPPKTGKSVDNVNDSLAKAQYEEAAKALESGNIDVAIQKLQLCVMLSPSHFDARELLVHAFVAKDDLQSAIISAKAWADAYPDNARARFMLGGVTFDSGDFATAELVLSRDNNSMDAEGVVLLAASMFRQGKKSEAITVLKDMHMDPADKVVWALRSLLLAWSKRESEYSDEDLQNLTTLLAIDADAQAATNAKLSLFNLQVENFPLLLQRLLLWMLLCLNHGDLRASIDGLYRRCKSRIDPDIVWSSNDPMLMGRILASVLCNNGKLALANTLVQMLCTKYPAFDIRLIQAERAFQNRVDNKSIAKWFTPDIVITESHGKFLNNITVYNSSSYTLSNIVVRITVTRSESLSDVIFEVRFPKLPPGGGKCKENVFKDAGWFGAGIDSVAMCVVACAQRQNVQELKLKDDAPVLADWHILFDKHPCLLI